MTKIKLKVLDVEPIGKGVAEKLGHVLGLAAKGEIASVAICTVYRDGSTGHSWSELHNFSLMIGGVARMQADLLEKAGSGE